MKLVERSPREAELPAWNGMVWSVLCLPNCMVRRSEVSNRVGGQGVRLKPRGVAVPSESLRKQRMKPQPVLEPDQSNKLNQSSLR